MSIVKVKTKYQVTLPDKIRKQAAVKIGDILEAKVEKGKITLTPKTIIDRGIAEGLEDIKRGRTFGPFYSAEEMIKSLHRNTKRLKKKSESRK